MLTTALSVAGWALLDGIQTGRDVARLEEKSLATERSLAVVASTLTRVEDKLDRLLERK